jgi:hypothetical protein
MRKITLTLETNKTVELSDFQISGSNTVSLTIKLVELDIQIPNFGYDFSGYSQWKKNNQTKTWRDYVKSVLLSIYNSYALSKQVKDMLDAESKEVSK